MKKAFIAVSMAVFFGFCTAVAMCVQALNGAQAVSAFDDGGMRIVVDAGHGGVDGGVVGRTTGVKESDLNLAIAHTLKEELESIGFEVTLTRKTEAGLYGAATKGFKKRDMQRRKEIIEETAPILVLSIHQNYYPSRAVRGGQVFYEETNARSAQLAECVQKQLNSIYAVQGAKERKTAKGDYFMLDCTEYPSVIVECGFLSNAADEALLCTDAWKKKLSEAIAVGVMGYLADGSV